MLYLFAVWFVLGLAAVVRSYVMVIGKDTPESRARQSEKLWVIGATLVTVGIVDLVVWFFVT